MLLAQGQIYAKNMAFYVPVGCVRFAGYCGKMYSSHLFPYGGLNHEPFDARKITKGREGEGKAFYMFELHWLAEIYFI